MYSLRARFQTKILWYTPEDTLLVLSVEKYGNTNWYKIVSNLYTKHIQQAKARWKGWSHPIVNKRQWTLQEDIHLSYQSKSLGRLLRQKFTERQRVPWQCFFRNIILRALQVQPPFYILSRLNLMNQDLRTTNPNEVANLDKMSILPHKKTLDLKARLVCLTGEKKVKKKGQDPVATHVTTIAVSATQVYVHSSAIFSTYPPYSYRYKSWFQTYQRQLEYHLTPKSV